jgi:hypothetical protein
MQLLGTIRANGGGDRHAVWNAAQEDTRGGR